MRKPVKNLYYYQSYMPQDSMYPFQGLNTLDPSTLCDPKYSPYCNNVFSDRGIVTKRHGLELFGSASPFEGNLIGMHTFRDENGIEITVAITDTHQYRYDSELADWKLCPNYMLESGTTATDWVDESDVTVSENGFLLAHWKMNDDEPSTTVTDSSGNSHDGDSTNNTSTMSISGKINEALEFDGETDYITVPHHTDFNFREGVDFSISVWFKTDNDGEQRFILDKYEVGHQLRLYKNFNNRLYFLIYDGVDIVVVNSNSVINDDTWHHVVVACDRDGYAKMYLDGTLQDNAEDISSLGNISNSVDLTIGCNTFLSVGHIWDGALDDIRIYSKALSSTQVDEIYNSGTGTEDDISYDDDYVTTRIASGFAGGLAATLTFAASKDILGGNTLSMVIRSDKDLLAGDVTIGLNTTSLDVPALTAGVEERVEIDYYGVYEDEELAYITLSTTETGFNFHIKNVQTICIWDEPDEDDDLWIDTEDGIDQNGLYLFIAGGENPLLVYKQEVGAELSMQLYQPTSGLGTLSYAKTVSIFLGSLVLANMKVDGSIEDNSIALSKPGDFYDFEATTADIILLDSIKGEILKVLPYMEALIIYGTNSIGVLRYVAGDAGYVFDIITSGETYVLSGRSIISIGAFHAIMLQDNIYLFNGTKELLPISKNISRTYTESLEVDEASRAFAFNDAYLKKAYFITPTSDDSIIFVLDYGDFTLKDNHFWTIYTFDYDMTCAAFYTENLTYTFDSNWAKDNTIGTVVASFDDLRFSPSAPRLIFGFNDFTAMLNRTLSTDLDSNVECEWQSIDFTVPEYYQTLMGRWIKLELEVEGIDVLVQYSVTKGNTWTTIDTLSDLGSRHSFVLPFDKASRHIRIRLWSDTWFKLYWLRVWISHGGL